MITQYFRPQTLEEALKLLAQPGTLPLGGGTILNQKRNLVFSVVDLQDLDLNQLKKNGDILEIGACVQLEMLLESEFTNLKLKTAIDLEKPLNIRNMATVAGTLVTCNGRSPFGTAMLALDAKCFLVSNEETMTILGDLLPLREETLLGKLITKFEIPMNVKFAFETVGRSPKDKPIVCAAMTRWPSGRTRLALGGWGAIPMLAMDGNDAGGVEEAARNAFAEAGDERASAEYRSDVAGVLAMRCLNNLQ